MVSVTLFFWIESSFLCSGWIEKSFSLAKPKRLWNRASSLRLHINFAPPPNMIQLWAASPLVSEMVHFSIGHFQSCGMSLFRSLWSSKSSEIDGNILSKFKRFNKILIGLKAISTIDSRVKEFSSSLRDRFPKNLSHESISREWFTYAK